MWNAEFPFGQWDEERDKADLERVGCLVLDVKESEQVKLPFEYWMSVNWAYYNDMSYAMDYFQIPTVSSILWRVKDGWVYCGTVPVTDESIKAERAKESAKRIAPWVEDYGREYKKCVDEILRITEPLKVDFTKVPDYALHTAFWDVIMAYKRIMELHFVMMYGYLEVYRIFLETCQRLFGFDRWSPEINKLMSGFPNLIFETDEKMFDLCKLAEESGLKEQFFDRIQDDEKCYKALKESEKAKKWMQEFEEFIAKYGWRTERNWGQSEPSWVESPWLAFRYIRRYFGQKVFRPREVRKNLEQERKKLEEDLISRVPEGERESFRKLLRSAQYSGIVEEEHVFYTENLGNAIVRNVTKEMGIRMAKKGCFDDPSDIYYLMPEEITLRFWSGVSAKKLVEARKQVVKQWKQTEPEFVLGDITKLNEMLWRDPVTSWSTAPSPRVVEDFKADLYGTCAAPGVAEGEVCVIMSEQEFTRFVPGSILVCPVTVSSWTPLFNVAKAVVTDGGGALSHAMVTGREYGIPVVSGTVEATKKLKNGMKVRVDGDRGAVYILEGPKCI